MKTKLSLFLLVCMLSIANTFAANRYWVGGTTGTWEATSSWSETDGGASGASAPLITDDVYFNNVNPSVTNSDTIAVNSITFTNSNAVFTGGFLISTGTMTVDNSQPSFKNNVEIVSALTFTGATPRITHSGLNSSNIYKFQLGLGGAFTLTGNNTNNYFDTTGNSSFRYNTSSNLTVFFKPTTSSSLAGINIDKGLITIGSNISVVRLNFPATSLNNQELILAPNITFNLNTGGSSTFSAADNGGSVNASASGSKFVIKSASSATSVYDGTKRIFKRGYTINNLELNSTGSTLILFEPIKVRTLTLTAGTINNSTHSITVVAGGSGVVTVSGSTTAAVLTNTAQSTRYWVGGIAGNWNNAANWGTSSGNTTTPGVPEIGDNVIFDGITGNESPTVALIDNQTTDAITFTNSNVTFTGAFGVSANTMTITNSQPTFAGPVTINSALSLNGALARISHLPTGSTIYRVTLGNGNAFSLTGNSVANYFEGNAYSNFTYNTTTPLTVFFKPNQSVGVVNVEKGLITLGSNLSTVRINFWDDKLNSQELILGENVTFTIAPGGSSNLTNSANGGVIVASATGSKVVINSIAPSILNSGDKRLFKSGTTIHTLEMNSVDNTYILGYPLTVKNLILTAGTINNSTNNINIVDGGKIEKTNGTTTSDVITALPGAPTNVLAVAGNAKATISFTIPEGDGGAPIMDYTVKAMPGNISVSGASSPIEITGLTNGVSYTFTVTAQNNLGDGAASQASNSVTPSASTALVNPLDKNTTVSIVNNQLIINYQAANGGMLSAKLISLNGQIIQSQTNAIVAGNNKLSMNIQALQAGVYILELTDNIHSLICKKISKN